MLKDNLLTDYLILFEGVGYQYLMNETSIHYNENN